jgi:glyoxylase-like metal-dependent hydrolase (beta-lactamase superfamily II)
MLSWQIGDVNVTRVVELELPVPYHEKYPMIAEARPEALKTMPWLYPHFVTQEGHLLLSIHALLVDTPGLKLVVDTCVGNDKARNLTRGQPLQTQFLEHLKEAGFARETVNIVVCTHLHVDHVGWNTMLVDSKWIATFPNAQYLIGRKEHEHWSKEGDSEQQEILADSVKPIFDAGLAREVEMDHRVSPEIRLIPTTGHTPGHVSVVIESKGETAIITGDMMHHPCQIGHPEWSPGFDSDKQAASVTRQLMIQDWADQPILIIGTHFAGPTAGYIKRDGECYKFAV